MTHVNFSEIGVVVNSVEELYELYLTYSALDIPFSDAFEEDYEDAQTNSLKGWYIQSTAGNITTKLNEDGLSISLINYPITYLMDSLDFAIACQLLNSNQTEELIAHLDKYCKEYK